MLLEGDISLQVINESDLFVTEDQLYQMFHPSSCSGCSGSEVFAAAWMILTVPAPALSF